MSRTDRLYAVREELRRAGASGRTAERLARTFEVSVRTIKRDISTLQQGGFPVRAQPGPGGGYVVEASATLPPVNVTEAEVSGLAAAVAAHRGQPFDGAARSALVKVLGAMDPQARERATALSERIWIDSAERAGEARVRHAVEAALTERRVLSVVPTQAPQSHDLPRDPMLRRRLDPVFLAHTRGTWWLVGRCREETEIVWLRLDEIRSARVTTEPAEDIPVSVVGTPSATATPARLE